ncbi:hypothetical protein X772_24365 [Mesorhizobium sp. LSJC280B00]|nr:hypothetical protein X772_24365 [Mesorhizobium sp. LSJC280B00]
MRRRLGQEIGQKIAAVEGQHGIERVEGFGPPRDDLSILDLGILPRHWLVLVRFADSFGKPESPSGTKESRR